MSQEDMKQRIREKFSYLFKGGELEMRKPHFAQMYINKGEEAGRKRDQFFDDAFVEIMMDLFQRWIQTELHEVQLRESLYQNVLALGAVNGKLDEYQTYARNAAFLIENETKEDEDKDES